MTLDDLEKCVSGETVLKFKDYGGELIYIHHNEKYFVGMYREDKDYEFYPIADIRGFEIKKPKKKLYAYIDEAGFIRRNIRELTDYNELYGLKRFSDADREV